MHRKESSYSVEARAKSSASQEIPGHQARTRETAGVMKALGQSSTSLTRLRVSLILYLQADIGNSNRTSDMVSLLKTPYWLKMLSLQLGAANVINHVSRAQSSVRKYMDSDQATT